VEDAVFLHVYIEEIELPFFSGVMHQRDEYFRRPAAFLPQIVPDDGDAGLVALFEQLAVDTGAGDPLLRRNTPGPLAQDLIDAWCDFVRYRPPPWSSLWLTDRLGRLKIF
jgi:hypothetical protein